jgi:RHS repeat-associated protein
LTVKEVGDDWDYDYDDRRLLQTVKQDSLSVAEYMYDAYGRRIRAVEDGATVDTIYMGNDIVYEVRDPDDTPEKIRYITANGRYLAKITPTGTYYYHTDGVGSIRALTDATGQVVARFDYEPFGDVSKTEGSYVNQEAHRFTGKPQDPGTGLYYFNARYYDSEIGRFISVDPARDGLNWYAYAAGNPLRYVDPDGEHTRWVSYIPLFGWGYTLGEGLYHLFGGRDNQDHDWCEWQSTMFISTAITAGSVGAVAAGLSNAGEIAQGTGNLIPGMSSLESRIITEARGIWSSKAFDTIRAAYASGTSAIVNIGGRTIQYEPGLPASGFTNFAGNGFVIGREAFISEAELGKTVLHELFRLTTSNAAQGVSGALAAQETKAAFNFAERAIGWLLK